MEIIFITNAFIHKYMRRFRLQKKLYAYIIRDSFKYVLETSYECLIWNEEKEKLVFFIIQ